MREKDIRSIRVFVSKIGFAVLVMLAITLIIRAFTTSLFFQKKDRINFVFYGEHPAYYSLSTQEGVSYLVYFYPDARVLVPGGYGYYRLGALGKLISLEKKRDILQKTFSSATSTTVDFYFYPSSSEIYYGQDLPTLTNVPQVLDLLFSRSNAGILNRIYLFLRVFSLERSDFTRLSSSASVEKNNQHFLNEEDFAKRLQGYFYNRSYRKERRNVQIIYSKSYSNALLTSRILEGSGIRIVDISHTEKSRGCRVIEEAKVYSETARDLSRFFNCSLEKGKASISDIILELGDREEEWKVK